MIERVNTYVCLFRGINVGGRRTIRMADLTSLLESIGFAGIETYLQSGNAVFDAKGESETSIASLATKEVEKAFGFDVSVIVRERRRFLKVRGQNPLVGLEGIDDAGLHVTFLSRPPAAAHLGWLEAFDPAPERLALLGDCVYLYCPNGYGRTKLSNNALERRLGTAATTRNWKTVNALHEILSTR